MKDFLANFNLKIVFIVLISASLIGCKVGPNYKPPESPTTKRYTALPLPQETVGIASAEDAGKQQAYRVGKDISGEWWKMFHSTQLNQLITEGINNSPNVAAAKAALKQSQELLREQIGNSYYPAVNLQLAAERSQISGLSFGSTTTTSIFGVYTAGAQASYILDVFGGQRRLVESVAAQVDYARYELLAAYLSLTSNIATNYISVASLQAQITTTKKLIQEQTQILSIVSQQLAVGSTSEQNVITQQTQLAQTIATLPPLERSLAATRHALAILVGKLPSELKPSEFSLDTLTLPQELPVSLPSKLVEQRPDIQASSALLHAASAQIGVATANMLPQFTIPATIGWISQTIPTLFTPSSYIWNYALQIAQPVFHGGALIAARRAAIAAFQESLAQYRQTVLQAFKDVSDALRFIQTDAEELKAQQTALIFSRSNLTITEDRFKVGGENYLDVLNAQKQYQTILLNQIKARAARFSDTAVLFQSLGGGWWNNAFSTAAFDKRQQPKNIDLPQPTTTAQLEGTKQ